jgi:ribosomal protein S18 acetylase RimI-like enzyme
MALASGAGTDVRVAEPDDVAAICQFGQAHVRAHYAPLIGAEAADGQVRSWWNESYLADAVSRGLVVVAEAGGQLIGVAQRGRRDTDHVVYKLSVHPAYRGRGLGLRLLREIAKLLPPDADRLHIEHFAANARAGAFYEREGFTVQRVEPSSTGDPALAVVWRARDLPLRQR